jgi:hypothetical protein
MLKRSFAALLVFALVLSAAPVAKADLPFSSNNAKNTGVIIGVVAVVAGLGFVIYYSVHHGHSLKGCAVSSADGLKLVNESNQETFDLTGETASIKPGDQVRVSGKKAKGTQGQRQFVVSKLSKDYGGCRANLAVH